MLELETWVFVAFVIAALIIGVGAGAFFTAWRSNRRQRHLRERTTELERENASLEATARGYEAQLDQARDHASLTQQLGPIATQLQSLGERVHRAENQREQQHGALAQQLRASLESEERLRASADSLSRALSSSQSRGMWGEVQLRRVVEASGMIERVDFDTQVSTTDGTSRPDLVVHLPGERHLAIDAKAPFDAYLRASALPDTSDFDSERRELLTAHARALRSHVDSLAKRSYASKLDSSPELVVLFVPSEALLSSALEADPGLLEHAFGRSIALASPVTLFSLLRSVATTWSQTQASEDAHEILALTTELYDRLATMAGHVGSLRKSLESTVRHFNAFNATLESRVLVTGRKLTALQRTKPIPANDAIDTAPNALTAPEFADE